MKRLSLIGFVLLLTGCGIFEPVPESYYKNKLAETPEPVIADNDHDTTLIITPSTWFGPATADVVDYVNSVTGETAKGPSVGGYLDNHPDWEQVPGEPL